MPYLLEVKSLIQRRVNIDLFQGLAFRLFPQTIYEQGVTCGNGHILIAIELVSNRRRGNCPANARFPKQLTSARV
jgi:hypothetical protein